MLVEFPIESMRISTLQMLSLAWFFAGTAAWGQAGNPEFHVSESGIPNGAVLTVVSTYNTEFTATIDCTLENATSSQPLPLTVESAGRQSFQIIEIKRKDPALAWKYTFKYNCKPGARRKETANPYAYVFPFPTRQHIPVLQGNLGKFSHFKGSQDEYAVDWKAAEGTTICASRAGMVTGLRQDSQVGGPDPLNKGKANYVIIKHDDGTFAEYMHIQPNGALVSLGSKVTEGQPIARSGKTGWSSTPHIHFAVFQTIDGYTRMTLPCRFKLNGAFVENLKEGVSY